MALYRTIQVSFWTDPKVSDNFTPEDKYFYLYLLTNTHTNLCGCYEVSVRQMSNETGYSKETIERLLERFAKTHQVIDYSEETKEILLLKWAKNNWTKSEKFLIGVERELKKVKNKKFKAFLEELIEDVDTVYIGYQYPMYTTNTLTNTNIHNINNIDKVNSKKKSKKEKPEQKTFGEFKNVFMTEEEFEKLKTLFPKHYQKYIEDLSGYIASKGAKYKSHYATIRQWIKRDGLAPSGEAAKDPNGREYKDGLLVWNIKFPESEAPPFYGAPEEWFENGELVPERVVSVYQPEVPKYGLHRPETLTRDKVLEEIRYRKEFFAKYGKSDG